MIEHECPRCHQAVELPLGELCPNCRREITGRARIWARWTALLSTALLVLYIVIRHPAGPNGQLIAVVSVGIWYFVSYRVVVRVAEEMLT